MGIRLWTTAVLAIGLVVESGNSGQAQGLLPPAPGGDLHQVSRRMSEALRDLGRRLGGQGRAVGGPYLARDCEELHRAAEEWHESSRGLTDPHQLRRSYSGIDTSWHRLRGRLAVAMGDPAIAEEVRIVDQADASIHQALNINAFPHNLEGATAPPTGVDEARRLAYSLAQRGEALAGSVQSVYGPNPNFASLLDEARDVARMADGLSDTFNNPNGPPPIDQAQQAFLPLFQRSTRLGMDLDRASMPPNVRNEWLAYATALNLARDSLKGPTPSPEFGQPVVLPGAPYNPNPAPQIAQWANGLDRQVDELIANFGPTVGVVPEGREMLGEMERLREDVRRFRGHADRGLEPGRLAFEFREVDSDWQRLARLVNRVARGRNGPNIQRVQQIGETCEQIHRALGMPGYPPILRR